jgi:large subunit ribosomal protein L23Ae
LQTEWLKNSFAKKPFFLFPEGTTKKVATASAKPATPKAAKPVKTKPADGAAKEKALKAKKNVLRGVNQTMKKKIRTNPRFRRPFTLRLPRTPKYPRKSTHHAPRMEQYKVIKYPPTTESAMKKIEDNNTLVFIVHQKANKPQIRMAVKKLYSIDVAKVNTLNR